MDTSDESPIAILHVIGSLDRGGVETWLMHVLRHIDRTRFRLDFLVHREKPGDYEEEARGLGARILRCPHHKRPIRYARRFLRLLREYGPYAVVHSHVHHYSGYVVFLAKSVGVPIRITQSHHDSSLETRGLRLGRQMYCLMTKWLIRKFATCRLAVSRTAGIALYGAKTSHRGAWQHLYCSIDMAPFRQAVCREKVRCQLNIPIDAFVLGHVGSFRKAKNHRFLVEIAAAVSERKPSSILLLVGDGPMKRSIQAAVQAKGLERSVIFAGQRDNVPELMIGAMDVFVLPSLHEGLPLVGIEAQAGRLPLVISDTVTEEVDLVPPLVRRMSLSRSASDWADACLTAATAGHSVSHQQALAEVSRSPFNIKRGVTELERLYLGAGFSSGPGGVTSRSVCEPRSES